jgi:hypothetical protein
MISSREHGQNDTNNTIELGLALIKATLVVVATTLISS